MIRLYLALAVVATLFGVVYAYQDASLLLREVARGVDVRQP